MAKEQCEKYVEENKNGFDKMGLEMTKPVKVK